MRHGEEAGKMGDNETKPIDDKPKPMKPVDEKAQEDAAKDREKTGGYQ